jgi:hypothetical protein
MDRIAARFGTGTVRPAALVEDDAGGGASRGDG